MLNFQNKINLPSIFISDHSYLKQVFVNIQPSCRVESFLVSVLVSFKKQIFDTNYIVISIDCNGMRNRLLSKLKAKKHLKYHRNSVQPNNLSENCLPSSESKAQSEMNYLTANKSSPNKLRKAFRLKLTGPRRAPLLHIKFLKKSYFLEIKEMVVLAKKKEIKDTNKQNIFRKTSEEYFRKLSAQDKVVSHSHSRKVSWKQQDSLIIFDKTRPPNQFMNDL